MSASGVAADRDPAGKAQRMVEAAVDIQGVNLGPPIITADRDALCEAVRRAAADHKAVVNYGDDHRGYGHAPPSRSVVIEPPSGILEHHRDDLTVTCRAGTTLESLNAALAEANQWLPLDGASPAMTIGEAIAHNVCGPLGLGFGGPSELVLGMGLADAAGRWVQVGGRTVKNVAGYDVTRLMVGSAHALGLIGELTLRTFAMPEQVTAVTLPAFDPAAVGRHLTEWLCDDAAPIAMDWQRRVDEDHGVLHIAYMGSPAECAARFAALRTLLPTLDYHPRRTGSRRRDGSLADDQQARAGRVAWRANASAVVKLIVPPRHWHRAARLLEGLDLTPGSVVDGLPPQGICLAGGPWSVEQARRIDTAIGQLLDEIGGMRAWLRRPGDTPSIDPIRPDPPSWPLLRRIGRELGADVRFNPGRLWRDERP